MSVKSFNHGSNFSEIGKEPMKIKKIGHASFTGLHFLGYMSIYREFPSKKCKLLLG
ncbi:hypothetical protein MTBBW1_1310059 [Desulfamplus magnetovallimortis]|uniref:Uncharacterized protein n=1 Tax=Desulfamplus magnetovallimortis TaxID=1246637 RepID=A0A1W1H7A5_9BACT|nr:hypothetical protein MTBBW1_1310059 [Desulfamplus magnetovallimortis]